MFFLRIAFHSSFQTPPRAVWSEVDSSDRLMDCVGLAYPSRRFGWWFHPVWPKATNLWFPDGPAVTFPPRLQISVRTGLTGKVTCRAAPSFARIDAYHQRVSLLTGPPASTF